MAESDILVATKNSVAVIDGRRIRIRKGITTARAGHPILEGRERLFRPLTVEYDLDAAPGGKRATPQPEPESNLPSQHDPKAAWVDWAVDTGRATRNEAEAMTKAELIDLR